VVAGVTAVSLPVTGGIDPAIPLAVATVLVVAGLALGRVRRAD
jgi:hypothetical protein